MSTIEDARLRATAKQDLHQAALLAQVSEERKVATERRLRLGRETGDAAIPPGAWVHFKQATLHQAKPGGLVLIRQGSDLKVRRLVRTSLDSAGGMVMHLAPPSGGALDKPLPARHLLGEVNCLEHEGRTYVIQLAGGSPVMQWLTDYGTCAPGEKLSRVLLGLLPPALRPR